MRSLCFFILTILPLICFSQRTRSSIFSKTDSLRRVLDRADTKTSDEVWKYQETDSGGGTINDTIAGLLVRILSSPSIIKYRPDSLLKHPFLHITHSGDKRLCVFTWYENTGGSFHSFPSVIHFRTLKGEPRALFSPYYDEGSFSLGGSIDSIIRLPHPTRQLYIRMQSVKSCNTCCVKGISIIELTADKINFDYPAFPSASESVAGVPTYTIESRCGSISKFEYNSKSAKLSYTYQTDDNTPVSVEEAETVTGTLRWNGKKFVETIKRK